MSDTDVDTLLKQQSQLESDRSTFDSWWQSIAYRVLPSDAVITTEDQQGTMRTERMFDSSPATANMRFAAIVEDLLTPRTQIWNTLSPPPELADDQESKEALEEINRRLYAMRYRPKANFAENRHLCYKALGPFGNYSLMIHDKPGEGACYEFIHPRESYWATDHYGTIDLHNRKFKLSARAAAQRFGIDNLPPKIKKAANDKPFERFVFLHAIRRNEDQQRGRSDYRGWEWASYAIAIEERHTIERSGYPVWPLAIGRYAVAPGEVYARSPAMECWPSIMTLNEEKKTVLRAGQKDVDPPMLLSEDGSLDPFSMQSSALNYGMVTDEGRPLAVPMKTGANVPLGLELMQLERQGVDDAFLTTIFKVLVDNPQMTATQVLEIARERAVLLAPTMGRLHAEDLGSMIGREIQILSANGMLQDIDIPEQLLEAADQYKIEYQSSLARAMRAADGVAILRVFESLPSAIALDPNAAYVVDVPGSVRELADINGMPAKLIRDEKQVAALAQQAAEADQAREALAAAPDLSTATLNAAKAEQIRMGAA